MNEQIVRGLFAAGLLGLIVYGGYWLRAFLQKEKALIKRELDIEFKENELRNLSIDIDELIERENKRSNSKPPGNAS